MGDVVSFRQKIRYAASQEYLYLSWPIKLKTYHCLYSFPLKKLVNETLTEPVNFEIMYIPLCPNPSTLLVSTSTSQLLLDFTSGTLSTLPLAPYTPTSFDLDPNCFHYYYQKTDPTDKHLLLLHPHEDPSSLIILSAANDTHKVHLPDFGDYDAVTYSG